MLVLTNVSIQSQKMYNINPVIVRHVVDKYVCPAIDFGTDYYYLNRNVRVKRREECNKRTRTCG
jgi:hypothetical protein